MKTLKNYVSYFSIAGIAVVTFLNTGLALGDEFLASKNKRMKAAAEANRILNGGSATTPAQMGTPMPSQNERAATTPAQMGTPMPSQNERAATTPAQMGTPMPSQNERAAFPAKPNLEKKQKASKARRM